MDYYYSKKYNRETSKYFDKASLEGFSNWNKEVFKPGKLDVKTKELVAIAATYLTRCPYCIESHTKKALKAGATKEEIAEVIQIAAALNAGACIAHMNFALEVELEDKK
ncbi:carboxymuconolactone decarboxylase family protein [Candidatus Bathyarchaeota archaeon]|nr:carboxymuconolactone decarboxylase family protein [Candidatus Bathyarchaeota archaeon]